MFDTNGILTTLKVNGIDETSPVVLIDQVLQALKLSPLETQQMYSILKSKGWKLEGLDSAQMFQPQVVSSAPAQTPMQPQNNYGPVVVAQIPNHKLEKTFFTALALIILLGAFGVVGYLLFQKGGFFVSSTQYTEDTFFSQLLSKSSQITSSSYGVSTALTVEERDADAKPFTIQVSNEAEIRQQYQDDYSRVENIRSILMMLGQYGPNTFEPSRKSYPTTLAKLIADNKDLYNQKTKITDPVSGNEYEYRVTEGGKNFDLVVMFATSDAVQSVAESSSFSIQNTSTTGETTDNKKPTTNVGKKVTFTKNSPNYFYFSNEPKKPFLVELGDSMKSLPADVRGSLAIQATSENKGETLGDFLFNVDAEGSLGDLSYKINADAMKKDSDYYFKINNIPSFFGTFSAFKGKWVKVPGNVSTSTESGYGTSEISYLAKELPEFEESFKKNKTQAIAFVKKVAAIADEVGLVVFKDTPKQETVDGRKLTRYVIQIKKDSILDFYTKLDDELKNNPELKEYSTLVDDQGLKEYFASQEFNEVFDYVDKNTQLVLWIDNEGFPAIMEYRMRVVPPDTAIQLAGKQIKIVFKVTLSDINKPINIKVPANAVLFEDVEKQVEDNQNYSVSKTEELKTTLSNLRSSVEIARSNSIYTQKQFALGACKKTTGTLFGNTDVFNFIEKATQSNPSKATCVSKGTAGNVTSWAISVPLSDTPEYSWCVDSAWSSIQIRGVLKSESCQ